MTGAGSSAMRVPLSPLQREQQGSAMWRECSSHAYLEHSKCSVCVSRSPITHTHLLRAGGMEGVEKRVNIHRRVVQLDGRGQSHLRIFNTHSIPGRKDYLKSDWKSFNMLKRNRIGGSLPLVRGLCLACFDYSLQCAPGGLG